jgi:hypothetical protein
MPIQKAGWELLITRLREDNRDGRRRIVGISGYFHDGAAVAVCPGMCAETRGPGTTPSQVTTGGSKPGVIRSRQAGNKYVTIGFKQSTSATIIPRPGLDVDNTNKRVGILIHPGRGFLSSIGCINPANSLARSKADIDF